MLGGVKPVAVDERVTGGVDEADVFHADALEFGGQKFGGAAAIVFVLGQSGDGRNAEEVFQFAQGSGDDSCVAKSTADERHEL